MTDLVRAAAELQHWLDAKGWQNCVIGGLALQRWGAHRLTKDVDLTLLAGFGDEEMYVDGLLGRYPSRLSDGRDFFIQRRVVLLKTADGIGIDVAWVPCLLKQARSGVPRIANTRPGYL
jgi:hypothetical protein